MINFRFHLISLIAVFLALGLGIVIGATVVDDAIVARLERDIDDVRKESGERNDENERLRDDLAIVNRYTEDAAGYTVEARLADVPVAVIAERGVNGDVVEEAVDLLRAAGADVPGVLWLEEQWALEAADQLEALKEATGATGSQLRVRALALDAVATRLTEGPPERAVGDEEPIDPIASLRSAGFLGFDGDDAVLAAFATRPARALVITGTQSDLLDADITFETARAFADVGVATAVGEVFVEGGDPPRIRGGTIAPIRGDQDLATEVSTVDDVELVQGRVAAVLALEDLARGVVGHYGYGAGANASLPEVQA